MTLAEVFAGLKQEAQTRIETRKAEDLAAFETIVAQMVKDTRKVVVEKCTAAAKDNKESCSIDISPAVKQHPFGAKFLHNLHVGDSTIRIDQNSDPAVRGFYFGTHPDGTSCLTVSTTVTLQFATFMNIICPRLVAELEQEGLGVKLVTQDVSNFNFPVYRHSRYLQLVKSIEVSWPTSPEQAKKRARVNPPGNFLRSCGICSEQKVMEALTPCGHVFCHACGITAKGICPVCRERVQGLQKIFLP